MAHWAVEPLAVQEESIMAERQIERPLLRFAKYIQKIWVLIRELHIRGTLQDVKQVEELRIVDQNKSYPPNKLLSVLYAMDSTAPKKFYKFLIVKEHTPESSSTLQIKDHDLRIGSYQTRLESRLPVSAVVDPRWPAVREQPCTIQNTDSGSRKQFQKPSTKPKASLSIAEFADMWLKIPLWLEYIEADELSISSSKS